MIYKIVHRKLKIEQHEPPLKTGGELRCSGMISSFCSNSDTRCVTIATNSEIRHEGGTDRIVINGTYP